MKAITEIVDQLTGPAIIQSLTEALRESVEDFPDSEARYHIAVDALRVALTEAHTPSLDDYLSALETDIRARLVYAGYNGFLANLVNFRQPFGLDFTHKDFFDIAKDHIIGHFPANYEAARVIDDFTRSIPEECQSYQQDICEYYIHMECTGPKLAHYAGYLIGNQLLPWVEPGYREDYHQTFLYAHEVEKYIGQNLANWNVF